MEHRNIRSQPTILHGAAAAVEVAQLLVGFRRDLRAVKSRFVPVDGHVRGIRIRRNRLRDACIRQVLWLQTAVRLLNGSAAEKKVQTVREAMDGEERHQGYRKDAYDGEDSNRQVG